MSELRIALLIVGVLLVAGLLAWEFVQRRAARRTERDFIAGSPAQDPLFDELDEGVSPARDRVEPSISFDAPLEGAVRETVREPLRAPPLVRIEEAESQRQDRGIPIVSAETVEDDHSAARVIEDAPTPADAPADAATDNATDAAPVELRLVWPPENQRTIVGLRVVGRNGEKITGGSLRQALLGEGFVHGELDIFHRALGDGRVIYSAASLTRPGNFDLSTMDANLYLGLNLFAMLPGALAGDDMFDRLLGSAQRIAQRLRAELQDSKGATLTDARMAELRREAAGAGIPTP